MKIAAAQIQAFEQNTNANIQNHLRMIELAALEKVDLILFPELSLTGYERALASSLSFTLGDSRLCVFIEKAKHHQMYIVVGAPISINSELFIGSFIFSPSGSSCIYTKQFLHDGEEQYFSPGNSLNPLIEWKDEKISFAICADISHAIHPENASKLGSNLYLAGIFYTPNGIDEAYKQLGLYAKNYSMNILIANYIGNSFNLPGAGKSAFWNAKGELVSNLNSTEENLLIVEF
ncbi:MAG: carbon-nitrogen hydrolase family protein [Bacteroidia bacterium]|nr:carbon-nitrogen hydrolase family protein [Bacteroidia bacterium]MCF8426644.1 carbon-nitrogen hydrolase family protein [Bacteroidia bacterium]MCF8446972.1 carbon-nitrogen hydrolase family protein [Bacteroidia bacterium]